MRTRTDELVRKIREQIKEEEKKRPPDPAREAVGGLSRSASLAALNRGWILDPRGEIRSHRRGIGPAIVAAKRVFRRLVLAVLEPYLERERDFLRETVRFLNEVAERSDRVSRELQADLEALKARIRSLEDAVEREEAGRKREEGKS